MRNSPKNLNPNSYPTHFISNCTYGVTITLKVHCRSIFLIKRRMSPRGWEYDSNKNHLKWRKSGEGGGGCFSWHKNHVKYLVLYFYSRIPIYRRCSCAAIEQRKGLHFASKVLSIMLFATKCGRWKKKILKLKNKRY